MQLHTQVLRIKSGLLVDFDFSLQITSLTHLPSPTLDRVVDSVLILLIRRLGLFPPEICQMWFGDIFAKYSQGQHTEKSA
jgi:hypothetical protein